MKAMHRTSPVATTGSSERRDLGAEPLLSAAQEVELATAARAGDAAARDRLVRANLGLVVAISKGYRGRGLEPEDLIGEGNLGLIRAATEFDPRFGVRFSTYAAHWIKQAIRHSLITTAPTIRLPAHMVTMLSKWRRAERELLRATGTPPSSGELAAALGLGAAKRRMVEQALLSCRLAPAGGDDGALAEAADDGGPPNAGAETEDARADLRRRLDRLDGRERTIVVQRYGLGGSEPRTLKEVGRGLGVTREWVRKIELRALEKLGDGDHRPAAKARIRRVRPGRSSMPAR